MSIKVPLFRTIGWGNTDEDTAIQEEASGWCNQALILGVVLFVVESRVIGTLGA